MSHSFHLNKTAALPNGLHPCHLHNTEISHGLAYLELRFATPIAQSVIAQYTTTPGWVHACG
jgi:hypothetical protein